MPLIPFCLLPPLLPLLPRELPLRELPPPREVLPLLPPPELDRFCFFACVLLPPLPPLLLPARAGVRRALLLWDFPDDEDDDEEDPL